MAYSRFAVYYLPPAGPLADFGAEWLGWDVVRGRVADQPDLPGLDDITRTPRKYGFHGTLKPPFRLHEGCGLPALKASTADLASRLAPGACEGLELAVIGRFLALTPAGDTADLRRIASACVRDLDEFRAPASDAELARRRGAGLSPRQEALLTDWGYPYVLEEFRFHLTLSGQVQKEQLGHWSDTLRSHLPDLPSPFMIDEIALCGEREDGRFELIHRYTLAG
jgi:putative phosphonate metabolism protein